MSISKLLGATMVAGAMTTGDGAADSVAPGTSSTRRGRHVEAPIGDNLLDPHLAAFHAGAARRERPLGAADKAARQAFVHVAGPAGGARLDAECAFQFSSSSPRVGQRGRRPRRAGG
ncbi:MAG: hypothetical protein JWM66_423 [Solirubrobacterales bacterium]|nr:hypothetical protein [Solirubrobacterales bacterium]